MGVLSAAFAAHRGHAFLGFSFVAGVAALAAFGQSGTPIAPMAASFEFALGGPEAYIICWQLGNNFLGNGDGGGCGAFFSFEVGGLRTALDGYRHASVHAGV